MILKKQIIGPSIALFFLILSGLCFALSSDKLKVMFVQAEEAVLNNKSGENIYTGNFKITQGSSRLHADKVYTYNNKKHKLAKMVAVSTSNELAKYETQPSPSKALIHAKAKTLSYTTDIKMIDLVGSAIVLQNKNTIQGEHLVYLTQQQLVLTPNKGKQKATLLLYPHQDTQTNKKNVTSSSTKKEVH